MTFSRFIRPHHIAMMAIIAAITLAGYLIIPAHISLPVHWNIFGQPDAFASRNYALPMIPAIILGIIVLIAVALKYAPTRHTENGKYVIRAALTAILLLCGAIQVGLVLIGYGVNIDMIRVLVFAIAGLLLILGNALPKSRPNAMAGLRLPWTLNDPAVWQAAHRIAGKLTLQGGLVLAISAIFISNTAWLVAIMIACALIPLIAASFISYRMSKSASA